MFKYALCFNAFLLFQLMRDKVKTRLQKNPT